MCVRLAARLSLWAKEGKYMPLKTAKRRDENGSPCMPRYHRAGRHVDSELISLGKAGRKRHLGIQPTVRGVAMNPVDHPHGGGEGKSPCRHALA